MSVSGHQGHCLLFLDLKKLRHSFQPYVCFIEEPSGFFHFSTDFHGLAIMERRILCVDPHICSFMQLDTRPTVHGFSSLYKSKKNNKTAMRLIYIYISSYYGGLLIVCFCGSDANPCNGVASFAIHLFWLWVTCWASRRDYSPLYLYVLCSPSDSYS